MVKFGEGNGRRGAGGGKEGRKPKLTVVEIKRRREKSTAAKRREESRYQAQNFKPWGGVVSIKKD